MSVPGNRGSDERVLYPVLALAVLLLAGGGLWVYRASQQPEPGSTAATIQGATYACTLIRAVQVGREVEIRVTGPYGTEQFRLPSNHPIAMKALRTEPGTAFQSPLAADRKVLYPP